MYRRMNVRLTWLPSCWYHFSTCPGCQPLLPCTYRDSPAAVWCSTPANRWTKLVETPRISTTCNVQCYSLSVSIDTMNNWPWGHGDNNVTYKRTLSNKTVKPFSNGWLYSSGSFRPNDCQHQIFSLAWQMTLAFEHSSLHTVCTRAFVCYTSTW